jgi:hypothetical protein
MRESRGQHRIPRGALIAIACSLIGACGSSGKPAHAPGEFSEVAPRLLQLGLGRLAAVREQVLAGSLGRLELGTGDAELLRGDLREPSAAVGVGPVRHAM